MSDWRRPRQGLTSPLSEATDHWLVRQARAGDQDAATQLYVRYAKRLLSLVKKRCSTALARQAGVDDIVQSVFGTFFRRVNQGVYDIPNGDTAWKVLLVIALNKIRSEARYHHATRRDSRRTVVGLEARNHLNSTSSVDGFAASHLNTILCDALEGLSARNRMLVTLAIEGHKYSEIAELVGCSTRTVERVTRELRLKLSELSRKDS